MSRNPRPASLRFVAVCLVCAGWTPLLALPAAAADSADASVSPAALPDAGTHKADAGTPAPSSTNEQADLRPLAAPLGRIGDVFSGPVAQHAPDDPVYALQLPGCTESPSLWLSRAVSGVALGGSQLQAWLDAHPGLETKLFGKSKRPVFAQTLQRARSSVGAPRPICPAVDGEGWRLAELRPGKLACSGERTPPGVFAQALFSQSRPGVKKPSGPPAALVVVSGAPAGAKEPCRPRLSVSFQDAQGRARLRYHADYGGVLSAELLGDRCQMVRFTFDASTNQFRPSLEPGGHGCARKAAQPSP